MFPVFNLHNIELKIGYLAKKILFWMVTSSRIKISIFLMKYLDKNHLYLEEKKF